MNFNSGAFLIYLPVAVGGYWLLPHRARKYWLLAASWFFYMYWNPLLILLLLASTAVDYLCGLGMEKHREKPGRRRALLWCSLCMNLGMLFFFKYWDFFGDIAARMLSLFGLDWRPPALHLILPVGISFYTFQTMSYTIDVYRGKAAAERDPVLFALFVAFFPQLVAGPIERPQDLMPQLRAEHKWDKSDFTAGIRLLLCGFFRKCVVADQCGIYVNRVFAGLEGANALAVAGAGALFAIQIYCDFAGYSEIAAGCARLMGIRLTRNFDRPYISQNYTEFFRRWHISLNRWFTQYVYIPLGGNRRGTLIKLRNTVIVFALCGLWHGANWTYVLWGLYSAFFVCLESLLEKPAAKFVSRLRIDLKDPKVCLFRRVYMFLIFIPAALLFRSRSISQIGEILRIFSNGDFAPGSAMSALGLNGFSLIALTLTLCAMARLHEWGQHDLPAASTAVGSARRHVTAAAFVIVIALCWLALLATEDAAVFAYFQF